MVHQEIYNTPERVLFRVSLVWPSGWKESSVLSVPSDKLADPSPWDQSASRFGAGGSQRFPISPALARHDLKNMHRVFLYSAVPAGSDDGGALGKWERPFVREIITKSKSYN